MHFKIRYFLMGPNDYDEDEYDWDEDEEEWYDYEEKVYRNHDQFIPLDVEYGDEYDTP